jgi:hypothetical protein
MERTNGFILSILLDSCFKKDHIKVALPRPTGKREKLEEDSLL